MQSIGIIPEAGSLAGAQSASGKGGTAAEGFLALLAALNGGAGLLLPAEQRDPQKAAPGQGQAGLPQIGSPSEPQAFAASQSAPGTEPATTDTAAILAAAGQAQANARAQQAGKAAAAQPGTPTPAATPELGGPGTPAQPALPGGQGPDPLAPRQGAAEVAPKPTTPPAGPIAGAPSQDKATAPSPQTSQAAAPSPQAAPGQAPLAAVQDPRIAAGPQTAQAGPAEAQASVKAAPQPRAAAQSQTEAPSQAQIGAGSLAAGAAAPRGTTARTADGAAMQSDVKATGGDKAAGGDAPTAAGERTLIASSVPAKPTLHGNAAKRAQAANVSQAEATAKAGQNAEPTASQNNQASSRPALWSAALASVQILQSADPDMLGQSLTGLDSGVEPLTGPNGSAGAKAGSDGYNQVASRMAHIPPNEQLAVQIQRAVNAQVQRFSIRLEPAELGRIDVRLDFARDGQVHAAITVERPETLDLMQRDIQALERSLKESGAQGQGLTLDLQLGNSGGEERRELSAEQDAEPGAAQRAEDEPSASPGLPDLSAIATRGAMTGLIDIRA